MEVRGGTGRECAFTLSRMIAHTYNVMWPLSLPTSMSSLCSADRSCSLPHLLLIKRMSDFKSKIYQKLEPDTIIPAIKLH